MWWPSGLGGFLVIQQPDVQWFELFSLPFSMPITKLFKENVIKTYYAVQEL